MRDWLRPVEFSSEIIDQKEGWSSSSIYVSYGRGRELPVLANGMKMLGGQLVFLTLKKESPFDRGSVKGAAPSTKEQDNNLGGTILQIDDALFSGAS